MYRRLAAVAVLAVPAFLNLPGGAPAGAAPAELGPPTDVAFTGLTLPYGVAVTGDGALTVTAFGDDATTVSRALRLANGTQTTLGLGDVGSPFGVAHDAAGATYVTDASANALLKVPAGGGDAAVVTTTGLSFPTGVAVDDAGNVFVADSGNARVVKLAAGSGAQSTVAITGLQNPYGVAVDADDNLYVADLDADRVVRIAGTGGAQTTVGFTGLESPDAVAVDAEGDVYVTDAGNDRVLEIPAAGGTQVALGFTGLETPAGVAVAADGSVYVADTGNDRVVALRAPGRTATESLVYAAYEDFVDRAPTPAELTAGTAALGAGSPAQRAAFVKGLSTSDVYLAAVVNRLYQDTLGRNGDSGGVGYWSGQLRSGKQSVAQVAASFYSSGEYFRGFGASSNETWVRDLYAKVLIRPADAGGVAYWVNIAATKGRLAVALPMYQSSESARTRVRGLYTLLLDRAPDSAGLTYWAGQVVTSGDLALAVNLAGSNEYAAKAVVRFP